MAELKFKDAYVPLTLLERYGKDSKLTPEGQATAAKEHREQAGYNALVEELRGAWGTGRGSR